jgi:hypothetical protein
MTSLMHRSLALLFAAQLAAGCSKDKHEPPDDKADSAKTDDGVEMPPEPDEPDEPPVVTRLFDCEFVAWDGEGEERQARFALTNEGKDPVERVQTWIYYYEGAEQIGRFPHALFQEFAPGARVEEKLGSKGKQGNSEVDGAACEVSEATYVGGSTWENLNLNYNHLLIPRPRSGETHEQLLARSGVAVEPIWDEKIPGSGEGGANFTLVNVEGESLTARTAWVYYYDVDGKQLGRTATNLMLGIEPGKPVEKQLGYQGDEVPEGTRYIEATVSSVELAGGKKWFNRNLAPIERPMATPLPNSPETKKE